MGKETDSCISWSSSPILTQLANDRSRILTKAWFLNHCYIAFSVLSVMWTISLSMVFIVSSYSEDLRSPCFLKNQVLNSGLHWLFCLFLSTWPFSLAGDWGGEERRSLSLWPAIFIPTLRSWLTLFSPLGRLLLCSWFKQMLLSLQQPHDLFPALFFTLIWGFLPSMCTVSPAPPSLVSGGVMLTPWECSEPHDSRLSLVLV